MRILYLAPCPPSPERPDVLHHPRLLARRHEVSVVVLYRHETELAWVETLRSAGVRVTALQLTVADSVKSCAARAFTPWPLYLAYYFNRRLLEAIQRVSREVRPDVVHAYTLRMAPYAARIGAPAVCNIQDVLTARYRGYVARPTIGWPLDVEERCKLGWFEPRLWRQMDRIGVVSEDEADDARALVSDIAPHVIRPGLDPAYFTPYPDSDRTRTVVFLGRFSYRPNIEAALRAARGVFPIVRRRLPGVRLVLVGSDPPAALRNLARDPDIIVTGRVEDVRPHVGRAAVSLSPMTTGGGVKYKVLQSLALATPVVTNRLGARGTGLTDGRDVVLAETDQAMAEACVELLEDPGRRKALGSHGRETVVHRHAWDTVAEALERFHAL